MLGSIIPLLRYRVPIAYPDAISIGPFRLTEKSGKYALIFWCIAASESWEYAILPVSLGILAGALFWWEDSPLKLAEMLELPNKICDSAMWFAKWIVVAEEEVVPGPLSLGIPGRLGSDAGAVVSVSSLRVRIATQRRAEGTVEGRLPSNFRAPLSTPLNELDPVVVEQLVSMGFESDDVVHALRRSAGRVESALEVLLAGGGAPSS
mmetsp:Transcript_14799/g.32784  ORF Transcript_14799/g.32784 Transcript_14799/m.32784 type:complete len:207 (-) Transcript_14799:195-815(-)